MVYELALLFKGSNSHGRFLGAPRQWLWLLKVPVQRPPGPVRFTFGFKKAKRDKGILWTPDQLGILDRSAKMSEQRGEEKTVKQCVYLDAKPRFENQQFNFPLDSAVPLPPPDL